MDIVLTNYYDNYISCINMKEAIYRQIRRTALNGTRDPELANQVTHEEHKNLLFLEKNILATQAYIFKGTKDTAAVGGEDEEDLYSFENRPNKLALAIKKKAAHAILHEMGIAHGHGEAEHGHGHGDSHGHGHGL